MENFQWVIFLSVFFYGFHGHDIHQPQADKTLVRMPTMFPSSRPCYALQGTSWGDELYQPNGRSIRLSPVVYSQSARVKVRQSTGSAGYAGYRCTRVAEESVGSIRLTGGLERDVMQVAAAVLRRLRQRQRVESLLFCNVW